MRMLSLFSGIGGIDLAAEWAGIEVVGFCEREPFCQKVLNKHWPNIPIFDDVTTLDKKTLQEGGIDVGTIDIVAGGFPCQPYSIAGKRGGEKDDRDLWPEMFRIIQELRPTWVVGENVANFVNMGLDRTLSNLEGEGYKTQSFVIPASSVGANHKRDRIFIVAHTHSQRCDKHKITNKSDNKGFGSREDTKRHVRDADIQSRLQTDQTINAIGSEWETREIAARQYRGETSGTHWENNQPDVCRVDDGVSRKLDKRRLTALGNAVVPQQIYPIFKAISEIEGVN